MFDYRIDFFNWSFKLSLEICSLNQKKTWTADGNYLHSTNVAEVQFKDFHAQDVQFSWT